MGSRLELRLGIDVGGTNTDAVVLDREDRLLARAKVPDDPRRDLRHRRRRGGGGRRSRHRSWAHHPRDARHDACDQRRPRASPPPPGRGAPDRRPRDARGPAAVRLARRPARGDLGRRGRSSEAGSSSTAARSSPLDPDAIAGFAGVGGRTRGVRGDHRACSPRSPPSTSSRPREIVREELGHDVPVSLSHEIGSIGLLERENATVLNAALTGVAHDVAGALRGGAGGTAASTRSPFFAQNDGTLMDLDYALRYPVLTIGSGPANSIRGAALPDGVDRRDRGRRRRHLDRRRACS